MSVSSIELFTAMISGVMFASKRVAVGVGFTVFWVVHLLIRFYNT